jgi:hypothetical protein
MTDEEADEYRKLFLGIYERSLPAGVSFPEALARRSLESAADLVATARMTISGDPLTAAFEINRVSQECALCGVVPPPSERQPATLHVHLQGGGLGLGVWVHPKCLSGCDETDQERAVPW